MRIAFLGTSEFACPALVALADRHEIVLVVTQPDRPVGRHAVLTPSPVKQEALRLGLPIDQPERVSRQPAVERLRSAAPETIVVASYGQLLKPPVFTLPPLGTINIHASLLPAYRGAAPVHWAIIRGETTTGVTTFLIDKGMDTGDLLLQRSLEIGSDETAGELETRLARLGAELIVNTLERLRDGTVTPTPQPEEGVSMAPMLSRDDGRIDWTVPAQRIHDLVRGTQPWPGAWTMLGDERVKLHRTALTDLEGGALGPGKLGPAATDRLLVGTGDRPIEILSIQREGRPRVRGVDFLHGLHGPATFS